MCRPVGPRKVAGAPASPAQATSTETSPRSLERNAISSPRSTPCWEWPQSLCLQGAVSSPRCQKDRCPVHRTSASKVRVARRKNRLVPVGGPCGVRPGSRSSPGLGGPGSGHRASSARLRLCEHRLSDELRLQRLLGFAPGWFSFVTLKPWDRRAQSFCVTRAFVLWWQEVAGRAGQRGHSPCSGPPALLPEGSRLEAPVLVALRHRGRPRILGPVWPAPGSSRVLFTLSRF